MATTRKTYPASLKVEIVREIWRETRSISQIAAQYGIHPNQLYTWRDQAAAALPAFFTAQVAATLAAQQAAHAVEVEQLYAEIGRLTTDLSWIKKSVRAKAPYRNWRRPNGPRGWPGTPPACAGSGTAATAPSAGPVVPPALPATAPAPPR